jgi:ribose/xylose/arabinose/galactoside ABC-type transport system permease subunit
MIRNGLNLLGVSPFWQGSAIGAIIIAAVAGRWDTMIMATSLSRSISLKS